MATREVTGVPGSRRRCERIPFAVQMRSVFASFFVQSSLNHSSMQGLGRLVCLLPVAKWLRLEGAEFPAFVRRHSGLFNSNPFIAPLGIGAIGRLERDRKLDPGVVPDGMIERFASRVSTPLGAVGDELFWVTIRPHAVLAGALVALLSASWGAWALLTVFTVWQAWYRWNTFTWGWQAGEQVGTVLRGELMHAPARYAGMAASMCAGASAVFVWARFGGVLSGMPVVSIAFMGSAVAAATVIHRRKPAVLALVAGVVWSLAVSVPARYLDW